MARVQGGAPAHQRVREALAMFGLWEDPGVCDVASPRHHEGIATSVLGDGGGDGGGGGITVVTGPSGSGKSTAMRSVRAHLERLNLPVLDANELVVSSSQPVAAMGEGDEMGLWLRTLSRAGLGEARLLARTGEQLSEGERHRLRLALAMRQGMQVPGTTVLIDEFVTPLDRATAEGVAFGVTRWARRIGARSGVRLVVASAHEDVERFVRPDRVVRCEALTDEVRVEEPCPARRGAPRIKIERGSMSDYAPLSRFHYLAGKPATVAGVWRAMRSVPGGGKRVAGVLVASYPTLNGRWRQEVWGDRYVGKSVEQKRRAAKRLNAELRCLSRVVVEPSSRGLGVARRLVQHYLRDPLTERTEAVAAMGAISPFFARAGMAAHQLEPRAVDERFARVLLGEGVSPVEALGRVDELLESSAVRHGVRVWVNATSEARRARANGASGRALLCAAACRLLSRPVAYTAG